METQVKAAEKEQTFVVGNILYLKHKMWTKNHCGIVLNASKQPLYSSFDKKPVTYLEIWWFKDYYKSEETVTFIENNYLVADKDITEKLLELASTEKAAKV